MAEQFDNLAPTERFSARAGHYAKSRPGYPTALLDFLVEEFALGPGSVIADVGSGTGILSRLLLERRLTVFAVEPNREMRQEAEISVRDSPNRENFHSVNGTAEATTLADASVDVVMAAQAFHWFDPDKAPGEFRRIARADGSVALIWNARRTDASAFMEEYERIVHEFGSEFARSGRELVPFDRLKHIFGPALKLRTFENFQELDWEGLRGRILSASYMPTEGAAGFAPMMEALRGSFDRHQRDGRVRLEYATQVYFAPLS